jgi:hypothetical protein
MRELSQFVTGGAMSKKKAYTVTAESDTIKVAVIFKDINVTTTTKTGDEIIRKPMLGTAHFLRALLTVGCGVHFPRVCKEFADFFQRMFNKYFEGRRG